MNMQEQRDAAVAKVKAAISENGLAVEFGHKPIHRFLEDLKIQLPSVAERYVDEPHKIRLAISTRFLNIPDDADASVMPVVGGQPHNTRKGHKRRRK